VASQATVAAIDGVGGGMTSGGGSNGLKPASPTGPIGTQQAFDLLPMQLQTISPNSTLFVANIGVNTTENDLRDIFGT
jgi:hypothetical protein